MTLEPDYFARLYARDDDPWSLASRWYERRKYALTIASLPQERYANGFEAGCSVGVLTSELSARCDRLLAVDVCAAAVATAARRTADLSNVRVERRTLPREWPPGTFDLVVLSEIGYYFAERDARELLATGCEALAPAGTLVAVHWRHPVADYPRSGDDVHQALAEAAADGGLVRTVHHEELDFLLEVFVKTPPDAKSVAQQAGLA